MGNKTSAGEVILRPSDSHTCCFELYNDGQTRCWDRSEFGLSKNEYIKQIECGVDFTLFLLSDHSVYFMGAGKYFYMPTNTTKPQILQMLKKYKFKQISAGYTHALFLQDDGTIWVAGENDAYQLNRTREPIFLRKSNAVYNAPITLIRAGKSQSAFLSSEGKFSITGSSAYGVVGHSNRTLTQMILKDPVVDIICGPDNTIAITNTGEAYGAGGNEYNRLGVQSRANIMTFSKVFRNIGEPIDKISINSKNAIVRTTSGAIHIFGRKTKEIPNFKVKHFDCSHSTSVMIDEENHIWICFGDAFEELDFNLSCDKDVKVTCSANRAMIWFTKKINHGQIPKMYIEQFADVTFIR